MVPAGALAAFTHLSESLQRQDSEPRLPRDKRFSESGSRCIGYARETKESDPHLIFKDGHMYVDAPPSSDKTD